MRYQYSVRIQLFQMPSSSCPVPDVCFLHANAPGPYLVSNRPSSANSGFESPMSNKCIVRSTDHGHVSFRYLRVRLSSRLSGPLCSGFRLGSETRRARQGKQDCSLVQLIQTDYGLATNEALGVHQWRSRDVGRLLRVAAEWRCPASAAARPAAPAGPCPLNQAAGETRV
ncbi:hypothetical protein N658DRAFT_309098 [Parathielavia hyrcaniae]|uniref:Uncharacterized protein n=1 Tax=Parathielavia hyrcaniae TaxID=113614 RepID=A0AAN6Q9D8_9PEZI|nr:hypothetical protein N658DRAFT_309098 [Parathielavia hyrcaniae]